MSDVANKMVTVFRSADSTATEEASAIVDMLADAGLNAMLLTDEYPGVLQGTVEVRVPAEEEEAALDVLDASHIPSVLIGSPTMPNLAFRVMVPEVFAVAAEQVLGEAENAGPAAAEEGEAASEEQQ